VYKYVFEYTTNYAHILIEGHEFLIAAAISGYKNNDPDFPILFNYIARMQDKFYFLRHLFLPFFALRYFIIKEPWPFLLFILLLL
jgi:hypothetical protein